MFTPLRWIGLAAILLGGLVVPRPARALTGNHQVIVAYYPIFPRWYTSEGCLFIGDLTLQYPLLGLYNNSTDTNVMRFDFGCMKNMGATVINPHFFSTSVNTALCDCIDSAAAVVGIQWTPTFEAFTEDPVGLATITSAFLAGYGSSPNLMKVDDRPVMFWRLAGASMTENAIANAVELVRAVSGQVTIILDANCLGQPCQICCGGNNAVSQWYKDPDGSTGYQRVNGFYSWVSVGWCMLSPSTRRTYVNNFVNRCVNSNMIPVLCTSPSYNEENWGYGVPGDNCGVGGDRSGQPNYNPSRSLSEWQANLNDLLYNNHASAWVYIQAYDEWAEGTTLAPTTYGCYGFLATARTALQTKGWLSDSTEYCRPEYPAGYNPSGCTTTPLCPPINHPPVVDAGTDQTIVWPDDNAVLDGTVSDDGLPNPPATITVEWTQISGPGTVTFADANSADTTATFSVRGTYVLRLTASDSELSSHDEMSVTVSAPPDKATSPNPADGASGASIATIVSWSSGNGTTLHLVHFGTSDPPAFCERQTSASYDPGSLSWLTRYFWRIDEVNAAGRTTGDVWQFTTAAAPGDFDEDHDVDQSDFGYLQTCFSGSGLPYGTGCEDADLDNDGDADQTDFERFYQCLSGAGQPPGC